MFGNLCCLLYAILLYLGKKVSRKQKGFMKRDDVIIAFYIHVFHIFSNIETSFSLLCLPILFIHIRNQLISASLN